MWKFAAAAIVAAVWTAEAKAQEQRVQVAPAPAWVQPAGAIKTGSPDDGAAVRFLLMDSQLHFGVEGTSSYQETALRIETPQGLQAVSTVTLPWDPALGGLTVHRLQIIRDGQVIDVLARQTFTVLRRESNLEAQALDGVLTAVIQPEDLRVGDVVDMAYTVTTKDPALAGHVQWALSAPNVAIDELRFRGGADQRSIYWRAGEGVDGLKPAVIGEGKGVSVSMKNVQPILPPQGAPARFHWGRYVQFSDFKSWAEVAAVMAPLYAKAAALAPASPLQAEITRIKAATADPKARAEAALGLVQDQVRYVALSMDDGGYVPADADQTWKRRFGDCKGKTTLLLALLHGLGIEAQPALVSSTDGDGLDQRLPSASVFDHVLVRATIAGRVYWLDGTRLGDRRLDGIETPDMAWALPVQAQGAGLVALTVAPPERPMSVANLRLDASKGLDMPAAVHGEVLFRGDEAVGLNLKMAGLTAAQRDEGLRTYWTGAYSYVTPTKMTAAFDPVAREERWVMDGTASLAWDPGTPSGRFLMVDGSTLGWTADFTRPPGPHADAPFSVAYPFFSEIHYVVVLPNKGSGFRVQGADYEQKVAGRSLVRHARIDKGVFTLDATMKSLVPEFPAAEADEAAKTLKELAKNTVYIGAPDAYVMTREEVDQYRKMTLTTARDLMKRGDAMRERGEFAQARSDMEKAVALDPASTDDMADLAQVYAMQGDFAAAHAMLEKALSLRPDDNYPNRIGGVVALLEAKSQDAVLYYSKALDKAPEDRIARRQRITAEQNLGDIDKAMADADVLLKPNPRDTDIRRLRVDILMGAGRSQEALAEVDAFVAAAPKEAYPHRLRANVLERLGQAKESQAEYDKALALNMTIGGYFTRANDRPYKDYAAKLADVKAGLKIDPANSGGQRILALTQAQAGDVEAGLAKIQALIAETPDDLSLRTDRAYLYAKANKPDLAEADIEWVRGHMDNNASAWNSICFDQAMWNVALDKALADCDKGLSLSPRSSAIIDSRALVLLRLGRLDEAIAGYDLALSLSPRQEESLYGRGIAKLRKGQVQEGLADLSAARRLSARIDDVFAERGVTPPAAYASSNSATR